MRTAWLLTALLAIPALQGCLGLGSSDNDAGDDKLVKNRADVSDSTGGIEGIVTDNAVAPIAGADIGIVELRLNTTTADDGSFAFSKLLPGTYTVVAQGPELVPASQTTEVRSGSVSSVDFVLLHLASDAPYKTPIELNGFFECGFAWWVSDAVPAATFNAASACGAVNIITETKTTNDRFLNDFDLDPPVRTYIEELVWQGGASLSSVLEIRGFLTQGPDYRSRFYDDGGRSPMVHRLERGAFDQMQTNFTEVCDDGAEAWCGYSFWDNGWPMTIRVFPYWDCLDAPVQVCPLLQQAYTHYITTFYNEPGPPGYSALAS